MTCPTPTSMCLIFALVMGTGCERRLDVVPADPREDSFRDKIDFEHMPAETRQLYDRIKDRTLAGASATDYQQLLDTAQHVRKRKQITHYTFQLTDFDKPYEQIEEEGVPVMYVMVQNKFGHVFRCGVSAPEF